MWFCLTSSSQQSLYTALLWATRDTCRMSSVRNYTLIYILIVITIPKTDSPLLVPKPAIQTQGKIGSSYKPRQDGWAECTTKMEAASRPCIKSKNNKIDQNLQAIWNKWPRCRMPCSYVSCFFVCLHWYCMHQRNVPYILEYKPTQI